MIAKLNKMSITEYIYCALVATITLLGWYYKSKWGYMYIIPVTLVAVVMFNDFKYMALSGLGLIFSVGTNFTTQTADFPIQFGVSVGLYILIALVYIARNGLNIKNIKSCKGIAGLALIAPIPLLWNNIVGENEKIIYFVYLSYFLYLLIYLIFVTTLKSDSFRMIKTSMIFMGLIVAIECIMYTIVHYKTWFGFDKGFSLGWAYAIDAGIVMIFALPFVFVNMVNETKWYKMALSFSLIVIFAMGIFCTCSRGSYLFGTITLLLSIFLCAIMSKKRWVYLLELAAFILVVALVAYYTIGFRKIWDTVLDKTFELDFGSNGRFEIWEYGFNDWKNGGMATWIFGLGSIAISDVYGQGIMYMHSTAVEILVKSGIVGCLLLLIHLFEKNYQVIKKIDFRSCAIMIIGYLSLDAYGMIDNTYGCYYYMIPLMIVMASIDTMIAKKKNINNIEPLLQ